MAVVDDEVVAQIAARIQNQGQAVCAIDDARALLSQFYASRAEVARLKAVEAAARAYRDEFLRQFAAVEEGTFTWHAEEYNARNQVRHALFEALDGA